MHGLTTLSIAALAGLANAWSYPDCEPDNCYRELTDARFYEEAVEFCPGYLAGKTSVIPTDFENCDNDASKVSSACSCITYSATTSTTSSVPTTSTTVSTTSTSTTETTSTSVPITKSSSIPVTTSTSVPVTKSSSSKPGHSSHSQKYTTSTVTETKTHTITSCKPEVTNCPGKPDQPYTTVETTIYTTVCPVTETETPTGNGTWVPPTATLTSTKKTLPGTISSTATGKPTTSSVVTAGAGRRGVEVAVGAAAVFAMLL